MKYRKLITILTVVAIAFVMTFANTNADPPEFDPPSLPSVPLKSLKSKVDGAEKVKKYLQQGKSTGDPILDSILEGRSSILDGSALDPKLDVVKSNTTSQQARAAESLLKAARQLEKLSNSDETRTKLIKQLRTEAGKLLL